MSPLLCYQSLTCPLACLNSLIQTGTKLIGHIFLCHAYPIVFRTSLQWVKGFHSFSTVFLLWRSLELAASPQFWGRWKALKGVLWVCLELQQRNGVPNPWGPFHTYFPTFRLNLLPKRSLTVAFYTMFLLYTQPRSTPTMPVVENRWGPNQHQKL